MFRSSHLTRMNLLWLLYKFQMHVVSKDDNYFNYFPVQLNSKDNDYFDYFSSPEWPRCGCLWGLDSSSLLLPPPGDHSHTSQVPQPQPTTTTTSTVRSVGEPDYSHTDFYYWHTQYWQYENFICIRLTIFWTAYSGSVWCDRILLIMPSFSLIYRRQIWSIQ